MCKSSYCELSDKIGINLHSFVAGCMSLLAVVVFLSQGFYFSYSALCIDRVVAHDFKQNLGLVFWSRSRMNE